jgi:hypothetical protein
MDRSLSKEREQETQGIDSLQNMKRKRGVTDNLNPWQDIIDDKHIQCQTELVAFDTQIK